MNASTAKIGRHWMVTKTDLDSVLTPLARPDSVLRGSRIGGITIDAGHGGKDTGAIGKGGTREKTLTLNVARRVAARLKQAGLTVRLTRESDRALELEDRCAIARKQGCTLFISLHFNAAASRIASGVETHILSSAGYPSTAATPRRVGRRTAWSGHRNGAGSLLLAYQVQKAMVTRLGETDRGVRRSNFAVLRDASFTAILVEGGFLSHPATETKLKTEAHLDRIAAAVTEGILAHVRAVRAAQLSPQKP
jgi:N-acetylmuramoyl-L-alanine amidase